MHPETRAAIERAASVTRFNRKTDQAYELLVTEVQAGREWPDAIADVCERYQLSEKQRRIVVARYDAT